MSFRLWHDVLDSTKIIPGLMFSHVILNVFFLYYLSRLITVIDNSITFECPGSVPNSWYLTGIDWPTLYIDKLLKCKNHPDAPSVSNHFPANFSETIGIFPVLDSHLTVQERTIITLSWWPCCFDAVFLIATCVI